MICSDSTFHFSVRYPWFLLVEVGIVLVHVVLGAELVISDDVFSFFFFGDSDRNSGGGCVVAWWSECRWILAGTCIVSE